MVQHANVVLCPCSPLPSMQVAQFQAEFSAALNGRHQAEVEDAKCRLIWALVHSSDPRHQRRGVDLARTALTHDQRSGDQVCTAAPPFHAPTACRSHAVQTFSHTYERHVPRDGQHGTLVPPLRRGRLTSSKPAAAQLRLETAQSLGAAADPSPQQLPANNPTGLCPDGVCWAPPPPTLFPPRLGGSSSTPCRLHCPILPGRRRCLAQDRELKYYLSVGLYKMGHWLEARAALQDLTSDYPGEFRSVGSGRIR